VKTLRETIAEAIYRHPNRDVSDAYKIADDALATVRQWLADQELAIVPKKATGAMFSAALQRDDHGDLYHGIYTAMIAAAPDALKAQDPAP
jgi:hypothetical protein